MQKDVRASTQDFAEPSGRAAVQEGSGHRRPEPSGAPPQGEASHEARPQSETPKLVLLPPPSEPFPALDDANDSRLRELITVETVLRKAETETEELVAQLGIALWLNKPARRKAAA